MIDTTRPQTLAELWLDYRDHTRDEVADAADLVTLDTERAAFYCGAGGLLGMLIRNINTEAPERNVDTIRRLLLECEQFLEHEYALARAGRQ